MKLRTLLLVVSGASQLLGGSCQFREYSAAPWVSTPDSFAPRASISESGSKSSVTRRSRAAGKTSHSGSDSGSVSSELEDDVFESPSPLSVGGVKPLLPGADSPNVFQHSQPESPAFTWTNKRPKATNRKKPLKRLQPSSETKLPSRVELRSPQTDVDSSDNEWTDIEDNDTTPRKKRSARSRKGRKPFFSKIRRPFKSPRAKKKSLGASVLRRNSESSDEEQFVDRHAQATRARLSRDRNLGSSSSDSDSDGNLGPPRGFRKIGKFPMENLPPLKLAPPKLITKLTFGVDSNSDYTTDSDKEAVTERREDRLKRRRKKKSSLRRSLSKILSWPGKANSGTDSSSGSDAGEWDYSAAKPARSGDKVLSLELPSGDESEFYWD